MKKYVVILLVVLAAACAPVQEPPVPGKVMITGDSVLWQGMLFGGDIRGANTEALYPGWRWSDAKPVVAAHVANTQLSPDVVVIAFGQNSTNPYNDFERESLLGLIMAPHSSACVVLVLPHPGRPERVEPIEAMRTDMALFASWRPNTVMVDFSTVVNAHPEYLASDGIHLNVPNWEDWDRVPHPAAVAYLDLVWQGVEQCQ